MTNGHRLCDETSGECVKHLIGETGYAKCCPSHVVFDPAGNLCTVCLAAFSARVRWMIPWLEYIGLLSVVRLPSNLDSDVSMYISLEVG